MNRGDKVKVTMKNGSIEEGLVNYIRNAPPDFSKPEAVSVILKNKQFMPGYNGTIFPAEKVRIIQNG
jgi:hypothetical protein